MLSREKWTLPPPNLAFLKSWTIPQQWHNFLYMEGGGEILIFKN